MSKKTKPVIHYLLGSLILALRETEDGEYGISVHMTDDYNVGAGSAWMPKIGFTAFLNKLRGYITDIEVQAGIEQPAQEVWVVMRHIAYEGDDLLAVCASKQAAIDFMMTPRKQGYSKEETVMPQAWLQKENNPDFLFTEHAYVGFSIFKDEVLK